MDLVLRKNDGEVSDTTVQKVEDEALTDELVDLVYSTTNMNTNMSEDKELNEIRNHFKKWKF